MTIELDLPPETEAKLRALVAQSGQDVQAIVLDALEEKLADRSPADQRLTDDEWNKKLRQVIELHPVVNHFVDDSRESIY